MDPPSEICPFTVLRSLFHLMAEPRVEGLLLGIAVEPDLCACLEHVLVVMLHCDGIFLTRASEELRDHFEFDDSLLYLSSLQLLFEVSDVLLLCPLFDGIVSEHRVEREQSLVVNRLQSRAEGHSLIVSVPPESHEVRHSSHIVLHRENLLPLEG